MGPADVCVDGCTPHGCDSPAGRERSRGVAGVSSELGRRAAPPKGRAFSGAHLPQSPPAEAALSASLLRRGKPGQTPGSSTQSAPARKPSLSSQIGDGGARLGLLRFGRGYGPPERPIRRGMESRTAAQDKDIQRRGRPSKPKPRPRSRASLQVRSFKLRWAASDSGARRLRGGEASTCTRLQRRRGARPSLAVALTQETGQRETS